MYNSLTLARAAGSAHASRNPAIAERAGRAEQAGLAVLALPTATGHYTTWSRGPATPIPIQDSGRIWGRTSNTMRCLSARFGRKAWAVSGSARQAHGGS